MIRYLVGTFAYRELILHLVKADLKRKQKNTVLGFLWSFLNPLLTMSVYLFIFKVIFKTRIENYPLFLFWGLLPFRASQIALSGAATSIVSKNRLIGNVAFPRIILPLTQVLSSGYEFLLTVLVLLPVSLALGGRIGPSVAFLPVIMLFQFVLTLGLALIVATLNTYFRDIENALPHVMRMWYYLSPGVYSLAQVPGFLQEFYAINPYSAIMSAYRDLMIHGQVPDFSIWPVPVAVTLLILLIGLSIFQRHEKVFPKLV